MLLDLMKSLGCCVEVADDVAVGNYVEVYHVIEFWQLPMLKWAVGTAHEVGVRPGAHSRSFCGLGEQGANGPRSALVVTEKDSQYNSDRSTCRSLGGVTMSDHGCRISTRIRRPAAHPPRMTDNG